MPAGCCQAGDQSPAHLVLGLRADKPIYLPWHGAGCGGSWSLPALQPPPSPVCSSPRSQVQQSRWDRPRTRLSYHHSSRRSPVGTAVPQGCDKIKPPAVHTGAVNLLLGGRSSPGPCFEMGLGPLRQLPGGLRPPAPDQAGALKTRL